MFIKLKRIYKVGKDTPTAKKGDIKTQSYLVAIDSVESIRPSNRLGYPDHRSTLTTNSGAVIDLQETFKEVEALINTAVFG